MWLSVGNRVCVCGQGKFLALLPWFESVASLYLRFRKFQIQNDILIILAEEDSFLIVSGRQRVRTPIVCGKLTKCNGVFARVKKKLFNV